MSCGGAVCKLGNGGRRRARTCCPSMISTAMPTQYTPAYGYDSSPDTSGVRSAWCPRPLSRSQPMT